MQSSPENRVRPPLSDERSIEHHGGARQRRRQWRQNRTATKRTPRPQQPQRQQRGKQQRQQFRSRVVLLFGSASHRRQRSRVHRHSPHPPSSEGRGRTYWPQSTLRAELALLSNVSDNFIIIIWKWRLFNCL